MSARLVSGTCTFVLPPGIPVPATLEAVRAASDRVEIEVLFDAGTWATVDGGLLFHLDDAVEADGSLPIVPLDAAVRATLRLDDGARARLGPDIADHVASALVASGGAGAGAGDDLDDVDPLRATTSWFLTSFTPEVASSGTRGSTHRTRFAEAPAVHATTGVPSVSVSVTDGNSDSDSGPGSDPGSGSGGRPTPGSASPGSASPGSASPGSASPGSASPGPASGPGSSSAAGPTTGGAGAELLAMAAAMLRDVGHPSEPADDSTLRVPVTTDELTYNVFVHVRPDGHHLLVYATAAEVVPVTARGPVMELITRINPTLLGTWFELDLDGGTLSARASLLLEGIQLADDTFIENAVSAAMDTLERFWPAIHAVAFEGLAPSDFPPVP